MKPTENATPIIVTALLMIGLITISAVIFGLPGDQNRLLLVDEEAFEAWIGEQRFFEGYINGWDDSRLCILEAEDRFLDAGLSYTTNDLLVAAEYSCFTQEWV